MGLVCRYIHYLVFFCFKQKTAYDMRISDWSSDVCSSDLVEAEAALLGALMIDNRIAEDVQLKLKPEHFFEPLHGRIYEAVMKLVERDMVAKDRKSTRLNSSH